VGQDLGVLKGEYIGLTIAGAKEQDKKLHVTIFFVRHMSAIGEGSWTLDDHTRAWTADAWPCCLSDD
jgi:hypothetical protein